MMNLKNFSFLLLISFLIFSCKKDDPITITKTDDNLPTLPVPVFINGSLSGTITDTNGEYLEGVNITVNNNSTTTDENGVFSLKDIPLNEKGAHIIAKMDNYYYNSKIVIPTENKMAFTKMTLIRKELSGSFDANTGGSVSTNDGAMVDIPSNSIVTKNGEPYLGIVNVYSYWLDPTDENLFLKMPGDLRGYDLNDNEVLLTTFGMINVELEAPNGQNLNMAKGHIATIEFPIPNALLGIAPTNIPLWHFNEETGVWIEEGEATIQNGKYIGTVKHFSFWNCDYPNEIIYLNGKVTSESGGIAGQLIKISVNSNSSTGYGYTYHDGTFKGLVPKNEKLTISIISQDPCNNNEVVYYSDQIGPFDTDAEIAPILLDAIANPDIGMATISGSLHCNNTPVSNGYVKLDKEGYLSQQIIHTESDGTFNTTLTGLCDPDYIQITGYNLDGFQKSQVKNLYIPTSGEIAAGDINACEISLTNFISFIRDGYEIVRSHPKVSITEYSFAKVLDITTQDNEPLINFSTSGENISLNTDIPIINFYYTISDTGTFPGNSNIDISDLTVKFSSFSTDSGGHIKGVISRNLDQTNEPIVLVTMSIIID